MDSVVFHISEASQRIGVIPKRLRVLEHQTRILPARCDINGRVYTALDIELLRTLSMGSRPQHLKRLEDVLKETYE